MQVSVKRVLASPVVPMFAAFAFMSFSTAVAGPVLGLLHEEFGVTFASLGLITGMQSLGRGLATLLAGRLADRYPARVLVSAGGVLMMIGSALVAVAPTFPVLVVGSAITGVSMAFVFTAGMTHLIRISVPAVRGRMIGLSMAGWGFGSLLAPLAAGALADEFGWRSIFVLAALVSVLATVVGWTVRSAPARSSPANVQPAHRWALGLTWMLVPVVVLSALTWGSGSTLMRYVLPLHGSEGALLEPAEIGRWLSLFGALGFGVMLISGTVLDRLGRLPALLLAASSGVAGGLILLLPTGVGPFILFGISTSLIGFSGPLIPVLVADRSAPAHVGRSMGVVQFLTDMVNLALPLLLGLLLDVSGFGAVGVYFIAALGFAAVIGARLVTKTLCMTAESGSVAAVVKSGPAPPVS